MEGNFFYFSIFIFFLFFTKLNQESIESRVMHCAGQPKASALQLDGTSHGEVFPGVEDSRL